MTRKMDARVVVGPAVDLRHSDSRREASWSRSDFGAGFELFERERSHRLLANLELEGELSFDRFELPSRSATVVLDR